MHRLLSSLLLVLCLGLAQHGALLHAIRHDLGDAGLVKEDDSAHRAGAVCLTCLAFAHMAGATTGSWLATPLLSLDFDWAVDVDFTGRHPQSPLPCSRGPPLAA